VAFERARAVLLDGRDTHAFPAAVCEVGRAGGPLWTEAFGQLTYAPDAPVTTTDTPFDLASLTKVIATTSIAMSLVRRGVIQVETPVAALFDRWRGIDREMVTVGHLLDHSSGLPAQLHIPPTTQARAAALDAMMTLPLDHHPGSSSVYSDVGFMLLGFLLESVSGRGLDSLWDTLWGSRPDVGRAEARLDYRPETAMRPHIAPTEIIPARGGLLQGTVHDESAEALGGVAAHAGLFGTAPSVGTFAAWVLRSFREATWLASPDLMKRFATRRAVPGSSRALGWDTMLPTSSSGTRLSPTAIGHTGFTGTSLWIDWERDVYVVLLTNRVHPTRENQHFLPYRARFHDAVMADLTGTER